MGGQRKKNMSCNEKHLTVKSLNDFFIKAKEKPDYKMKQKTEKWRSGYIYGSINQR